jgi:hypothetical protein
MVEWWEIVDYGGERVVNGGWCLVGKWWNGDEKENDNGKMVSNGGWWWLNDGQK